MTNGKAELNLPPLSARQLMLATLVVGLVVLGFWLLFRFHQVVLMLLAGIIISLALEPVVQRLKARGVPPAVAVGALYGLIVIVGVLFLRFGLPLLAEQSANIGAQLGEIYASFVQSLHDAPNLLLRRLADALPSQPSLPAAPAPDAAADPEAENIFEQALRFLGLGAGALFKIAAIFVIAFYWTLESDRIKRSFVALLPLNQREPTRELFVEIEQRVGAYVTGQLLLSLIMGALSLAAYLIIGLPYAPLLALFVGLMEIIPLIGPLIGAVPALLIGFTISPTIALWTVVASLIIHQLESNFFGPRVMKRTLNMRPLVTLLALTAFGTLFGVLGAIVALPLAAVIQLLFDRFLVEAAPRSNGNGERDRVGLLRYEAQEFMEDVRKVIRRREVETVETEQQSETVEDSLEAIGQDLDSLLAKIREPEAVL